MLGEGHSWGMRSLSTDHLLCCPYCLCHEKVSSVKTRIGDSEIFIVNYQKPHMSDEHASIGLQVVGVITHKMKHACSQEAGTILPLGGP